MTCDEYKYLLHEYFMGRLAPDDVERLDAHRAECEDCDRIMTLAQETTCRDFTELLNDYVEESLPTERREIFDRHLSICPDCTAYLQSYRATMSLSVFAMKGAMRHLADDLPSSLVEAILAARLEEEQKGGGKD